MKYQYVGNGAGIIGLPRVVSDEEAAEMGVSDLLMAAIGNGSYEVVDKPPSPPAPLPKGRGEKKKE